MFVANVPAGGNVSALVSFTVPVSGEVQIQFEVNPIMSSGARLFAETWTHDNTYDRTYVTRSPTDGASWSSSVAGHGAVASFASAVGQQSIGTASAGFTAGNPVSQAAWGNTAASSGATESTGQNGKSDASSSSAYASSSQSISSAAWSSSSNGHATGGSSGEQSGSGVLTPSSDASDSSSSGSLSGPQATAILALVPYGGNPRIVLAGNPDTVLYAAVVASDSVIARVDFEYAAQVLPTASHTATSFLVALPAKLTGTNVLVATAYDTNGVELSRTSVSVPVLTLPPWVLAMQPTTAYQRDGSWVVSAQWRTTLKGGKLAALSGTTLVDVTLTFADSVLDLTLTVHCNGAATLRGNGTMAVQATQPSGASTPAASLDVSVVGNITMDDSHGFGNDVDLVLRSLQVGFGGQVTLALPELFTSAPVTLPSDAASVPLSVPLSVSLSLAPKSAVVTLTESDYDNLVLGGLPIALPSAELIDPISLGLSLAVTAHSAAGVTLTVPCSATAPIRADAIWSPSEGLRFSSTSAALTLACPLCVDALAGRQCTEAAALLTWSLLRPQLPMPPQLPWSLIGTLRLLAQQDSVLLAH